MDHKPLSGSGRAKNFQKSFSGFMSFLKILKIILGLSKEVSGSGRSPKSLYLRKIG
jgi:hypothetical protein